MDETTLVKGKILTKSLFTDELVRLKIKNVKPLQVPYKPGQFISIKASEKQYTPYYVFKYDENINAFEVAASLSGDGAGPNYLKSIGVGDDIEYTVPEGNLQLNLEAKAVFLIATGTCLSPYVSFLYYVQKSPIKPEITLFWGVKNEQQLYLINTLYAFSTSIPNFSYYVFLEGGHTSVRHRPGLVTDAIKEVQFDDRALVYVCSDPKNVNDILTVLKAKEVTQDRIVFEKYLDVVEKEISQ